MPAQINPKFPLSVGWSQGSVSLRDTASWKSEMSAEKDKKGTLFGRRPKATPNALEKGGDSRMVENLCFIWMWTVDLDVKLTSNHWIHHFIDALESLNVCFCCAFWRPHGVVHTGHILFTFIVLNIDRQHASFYSGLLFFQCLTSWASCCINCGVKLVNMLKMD